MGNYSQKNKLPKVISTASLSNIYMTNPIANLENIIKQRQGTPMLDIDAVLTLNKPNEDDILYQAYVPNGMNVVLRFISLSVLSGSSGSYKVSWIAGGGSASGRILIPDRDSSTNLLSFVSCPPGTKLNILQGAETSGNRVIDVIASGDAFAI